MPEGNVADQQQGQGQGQSTQQGGQTGDGQHQQQGQGQQNQQQPNAQNGQQRTDAGQNNGQADQNRGLIADLQKERQARQRFEQEVQRVQAELAAERRRVQALAGVAPKSDAETEVEEVRARLLQIFPALGKLTDERLDQLMQLNERAGSIEEAAQHHWTTHGRQMLESVADAVAEAVGSDLSERQVKALNRAYVAEAEANPEFLARHEAGDPTLIEEFAKQWIEDWFEPARRRVVTEEVGRRRPVPNGRDRNVQTTPPKKIDFKDEKAVSDAMVESFKSHGGRFES